MKGFANNSKTLQRETWENINMKKKTLENGKWRKSENFHLGGRELTHSKMNMEEGKQGIREERASSQHKNMLWKWREEVY